MHRLARPNFAIALILPALSGCKCAADAPAPGPAGPAAAAGVATPAAPAAAPAPAVPAAPADPAAAGVPEALAGAPPAYPDAPASKGAEVPPPSAQRALDAPTPFGAPYAPATVPPDVAAIEGRAGWPGAAPPATEFAVPPDAQAACGASQSWSPVARAPSGAVAGAFARVVGLAAGMGFGPVMFAPTVLLRACRIEPRAIVLPAGGTLHIQNVDPVDHVVVARRDGRELFRATVKAGTTAQHRVDGPGFVELAGGPGREWMRGFALAADTPYAAATDEGGLYRLSSVPHGDREVELWHPPVAEGGRPLVLRRTVPVGKWVKSWADFALGPTPDGDGR